MIYSVDFEDLSGKIKNIEIAKYLRDLGWQKIPTKRESVKIFQLENENGFFQVDLPMSRTLRDYSSAMFRAVQSIAESTKKSVEQVILELLNPLSDIIRLRINEPSIEAGSIFVDDAINLYNNAKKLLQATALDVTRPELLHVGRTEKSVADFVNSCRFGQTEIGSYVVSIVCPISQISQNQLVQMSLFDNEDDSANSLTRKVVNKLIRSVELIRNSAYDGNIDSVVHEQSEPKNLISANFLEALSNINIYREESELEIAVKYAPTVKGNTLTTTSVSIGNDCFAPIDAVVKKIKRIQENEKSYIGHITTLNRGVEPSASEKGKITMVFINDEGNKATASVVLQKEDYEAAIEAHMHRKPVKVLGELSGQANNKKIDYSYFEVLD